MQPSEPGWYFCTYKKFGLRQIVLVIANDGELLAERTGHTVLMHLEHFEAWSERLIDPRAEKP